MEIVSILMCRRNSLISRLIRLASKSEWSHTSNKVSVWGSDHIIEMQKEQIQEYTIKEWEQVWGYTFIEYLPPKGFNNRRAAERLMSARELNVKYDFCNLLVKVPRYLMTGKYKENKRHNNRMTCVELTVWAFDLPVELRTPQQVKDYLDKNWEKI
jgi:hypothetical protein